MTTLEKRLTDFAGRTDVSDSNTSFAKSLLSNYKKWNGLPGLSKKEYWLPEGGMSQLALSGIRQLVEEINIDYDCTKHTSRRKEKIQCQSFPFCPELGVG